MPVLTTAVGVRGVGLCLLTKEFFLIRAECRIEQMLVDLPVVFRKVYAKIAQWCPTNGERVTVGLTLVRSIHFIDPQLQGHTPTLSVESLRGKTNLRNRKRQRSDTIRCANICVRTGSRM